MALRIGWGSGPMLVISVGGFHPAFREIPDDLRDMTRMTIALLSGDNPRLTVQTYFAVTSNTVQNGARVELYAEACGFNIYGFLGYDLLVQFNPVHFIASISAGIALREGTERDRRASRVRGELSGPAPWNANGDASLEILFFEISVGFNETWGDDAPPDPVEIEDVTGARDRRASTTTATGWPTHPANSTAGVSVRALELARRQDRAAALRRAVGQPEGGSARLSAARNSATRSPTSIGSNSTTALGGVQDEREEFAVAQYKKLSDSDKLSAPSFERMKSGLRFSTGRCQRVRRARRVSRWTMS